MGTRIPPHDSDSFEEAVTGRIPVDDDGVPVFLGEDEDSTRPIDVAEMEAAARRSLHVADPKEQPRIIRRAPTAPPDGVRAEICIAGTGSLVELPVHAETASGMSLVIPPGRELDLRPGSAVTVHLRRGGDAPEVKVATVAHLRPPRGDFAGGLSVRWTD